MQVGTLRVNSLTEQSYLSVCYWKKTKVGQSGQSFVKQQKLNILLWSVDVET